MASDDGRKDDAGKAPLDLLPFDALTEVGKVLQFGAAKYDPRNWEKGMRWGKVLAALLRHVFLWAMCRGKDDETGLSHMAHAMCCAMFLLAYELRGIGEDDRPGAAR